MSPPKRNQTRARRRVLVAFMAVGVAALVAVVVTVVALNRHPVTPAVPPGMPPTATTTTTTTAVESLPVLAVKIDNVAAARPQTGIASASIVYVEPVEGGLTRLMAVFTGTPPPVVGPVRSARHTDLDLLRLFGKPTFAYSGAAPPVLADVRAANLVDASPATMASAYERSGARAAPHNLYLHPARLTARPAPPAQAPFVYGAAPVAGTRASRYTVAYRAASYAFTWSSATHRWLIAMDGTPVVDTAAAQVSAATVVVQRVVVHTDESVPENHGRSPVAQTVGTGPAVVLRNGQAITATWHRRDAADPVRFTAGAEALPLAADPVWVLLLPR